MFKIDPVFNLRDDGLDGLCAVLEEIFFVWLQRTDVHPANARAQIGFHAGQQIEADNHVATADVNVVFQTDRHGLRAERFIHRTVVSPDVLHGRLDRAGQDGDLLAFAQNAAGDLAAQAAKVVKFLISRIVLGD